MKKKIVKKRLGKLAQRVAIAKDVLKLIGANKIVEETGNAYMQIPYLYNSFYDVPIDGTSQGVSLQKILKNTTEPCTVCALGSMMYAYVLKNNNYNVYEHNINIEILSCNPYSSYNPLGKIFPDYYLRYIEDSFEYENISLEDIMKEIIRNKGKLIYRDTE